MVVFIAPSAIVEDGVLLGDGTSVWHRAQVRSGSTLGQNCTIASAAFIDCDVVMGDDCKVQNLALLYAPARLGHGVFIGPGAILTNDKYPRAVNPDGSKKSAADWEHVGVEIADGAAIGAGAICVAPVRVGSWAVVASGAVVVRDVPNFGLAVGVPASRVGWVGQEGVRLRSLGESRFQCPVSGRTYVEVAPEELVEEVQ